MTRRTYSFQLYRTKRLRYLHAQIELAAEIYNHCIAVHRRYYRRYGRYLPLHRLQKQLTRLKRTRRYAHWQGLGSQAIQNLAERIDWGYQKFFRQENRRPPTFRPRRKAKSFTLKQAGWRYLGGNRVRIGPYVFRFHHSREIPDTVKTVTIKRDMTGRVCVYFSCVVGEPPVARAMTGHSAGFDFGLQTFLTGQDDTHVHAPLYLRRSLRHLRQASRALARKPRGSRHRHQARLRLARLHRHIANQRRAWHWETAYRLCHQYDVLYFEDLDLRGMSALWGRKVADLGFGQFVSVLHHVAQKTGAAVFHIDRFFPSTKLCHVCGVLNETITLRDRVWTCSCGTTQQRDLNAARNIYREGASSRGQGGCKTSVLAATA